MALADEIVKGIVLHLDPDVLEKGGASYTCPSATRVQNPRFFMCVDLLECEMGLWAPIFPRQTSVRVQLDKSGAYGHPKWTSGDSFLDPNQIWQASHSVVADAAASGKDLSRPGARNGLAPGLVPTLDPAALVEDRQTEQSSTALVEVAPGTVVMFGDMLQGLEPVDVRLIPSVDLDRLFSVSLSAIGNTATVAGNLANAFAASQGLYRVNEATLALLRSGGQLAVKDGANLGTVLVNGSFAQARFIPYGVTAAQTAAAVGPAIAMIALQMQLSEISGLVRTNIALTTKVLETVRHEQWARLRGLAGAIDKTIAEASAIGAVPDSLWDDVAGKRNELLEQCDLYSQHVDSHLKQLRQLRGKDRREYLEGNAQAIVVDSNALLVALKARTQYDLLRIARARSVAGDDQHESDLAELIARNASEELESTLWKTGELVEAMRLELRIIAELPGRATIPLSKRRSHSKVSQATCNELLKVIEPLATSLRPEAEPLEVPEVLCAPNGLALDPYLRILRWFVEHDETLLGLGFAYAPGPRDLLGQSPSLLATRVDMSWLALGQGKLPAVVGSTATTTLVAVTNRRVFTAAARTFLREAEVGRDFSLSDVNDVRLERDKQAPGPISIRLTSPAGNVTWIFPRAAGLKAVRSMAVLLKPATAEASLGELPTDAAEPEVDESPSDPAEP